jgi:enterochelin esterase-like enzyme
MSAAVRWLAVFLCATLAFAQRSAEFSSTEVHSDRTVTFRFAAPEAAKVELLLENHAEPLPMQKGRDGVWNLTTTALPPEIYGYRFSVDGGATVRDPQNPAKRYGNSLLMIPGASPQPWERTGVPQGSVTRHSYTTKTIVGLPDDRSEFLVYTPPGYDPKGQPYPVLYLLHIWGDEPGSWVEFAQANVILDNLIAQGKARPMVVVMPLGYGDMSFVKDYKVWNDRAAIARNLDLFSKALLTEVMPQVEQGYNVRRDAAGRAILGASMGGLESLAVGLRHPETFGWVGGESAALQHQEFGELLATFDPKAAGRRLVWMVWGKDDELAGDNRRLAAWLRRKGQPVSFNETEGTHSYIIWREGLVRFTQLIFPSGG